VVAWRSFTQIRGCLTGEESAVLLLIATFIQTLSFELLISHPSHTKLVAADVASKVSKRGAVLCAQISVNGFDLRIAIVIQLFVQCSYSYLVVSPM